MSATTIEPGPVAMPPVVTSTDGPRKRRKRAPVAGAADDCFTCANRNATCDRRRPYCSTCLETGQDCAGYKTQLTWGVGVASRGKLRGLSLPIAGTKKVAEPASPPKKKRTTSSTNTSVQFVPNKTPNLPLSPESTSESTFKTRRPPLSSTLSGYQPVRPQPQRARHSVSGSAVRAPPQLDLLPSPASSHVEASPINIAWTTSSSMQPQSMYNPSPISPVSFSTPSHHASYLDSMPPNYHEAYSTMESYPGMTAVTSPTFPPNSGASYQNPHETYQHQEPFFPPSSAFHDLTIDTQFSSLPEEDVEEIVRDDPVSATSALSLSSSPLLADGNIKWTPFAGVNAVGNTPRMQYLIQYYVEVIAPVIVAFDGPTNPFRHQILNLATKSDSLQHALSALAASNLRQRKESGALSTGKTLPARRSSAAHLSLTTDRYQTPIIPARDQKREEVYHKFHAVRALNAALADPSLLKDDAVLATLLVLCLFHICDSGIARFQTQFAGVKKLLNLRGNEVGAEEDHSTKWMTRLFTWFDAMAATVNERESQFDGHVLESSAFSDGDWSYETLAGVDGRLFKTMSQLGRLNILSQGKAVESNHALVSRPLPFPTSPFAPAADPDSFDGNGWMRIVEDENFFNMKTMSNAYPQDHEFHQNCSTESWGSLSDGPPRSEQFWREWREVRGQLQAWNMDTLLHENTNHHNGPRLTSDQCVDIDNISNAFRYSALLYTERLGHPTLPSRHEKIQFWVQRSLHHIRQVRSDVYLLWPLFITGSECVHEEERNIIRERCEDIQKDSGFVNNASCLALLEKVWNVVPTVPMENSQNIPQTLKQQNQEFAFEFDGSSDDILGIFSQHEPKHADDGNVNGFRFRNVMQAENNEGEWIVV